jgi:hypothetical protein
VKGRGVRHALPFAQVRYLLHHGAEAELRDAEGRVAEEGAAAAPGGDEARAALLAALRDPTLRLVAKAKAAQLPLTLPLRLSLTPTPTSTRTPILTPTLTPTLPLP